MSLSLSRTPTNPGAVYWSHDTDICIISIKIENYLIQIIFGIVIISSSGSSGISMFSDCYIFAEYDLFQPTILKKMYKQGVSKNRFFELGFLRLTPLLKSTNNFPFNKSNFRHKI